MKEDVQPAPLDPAWNLMDAPMRDLLDTADDPRRAEALVNAVGEYWACGDDDWRRRLACKDLGRALQRRGVALGAGQARALLEIVRQHSHFPLLWAPLVEALAAVVAREGMSPELQRALLETAEAAAARQATFLRDALREIAESSKERPAELAGTKGASARLPGRMQTLLDDIVDETILRNVKTRELDEVRRVELFGPSEYAAAVLAIMRKRHEGWWGNVLAVIEDRPIPAGMSEDDVVAIVNGSAQASCALYAIIVAETFARVHGVPPALAKAAQSPKLASVAELYGKKWIVRLRALAEGRVHVPKGKTKARSGVSIAIGELRLTVPDGWHVLHADGKQHPGQRAWMNELDEELDEEHISRWMKQVVSTVRQGAKKDAWPFVVIASGKGIAILVCSADPKTSTYLEKNVLGLHVDESGSRKLAGKTVGVLGGLSYGGEDIGFDRGEILVHEDVVIATMSAGEIDLRPVMRGVKRAEEGPRIKVEGRSPGRA